jgi:hypothetical protein
MPRKLLLLLFITPLLFQACGDDDEVTRQDLLTGTWVIESAALSDYSITISNITLTRETIQTNPLFADDADDFEALLEQLSDELFPAGTTITFNDDNTYTLANSGSPGSIQDTWALSSDEQSITVQLGDDDITDDSIDQLVFNITELSNTSLTLILTIGEDELELDLDGEGLTIDEFNIEYEFRFNKQ